MSGFAAAGAAAPPATKAVLAFGLIIARITGSETCAAFSVFRDSRSVAKSVSGADRIFSRMTSSPSPRDTMSITSWFVSLRFVSSWPRADNKHATVRIAPSRTTTFRNGRYIELLRVLTRFGLFVVELRKVCRLYSKNQNRGKESFLEHAPVR